MMIAQKTLWNILEKKKKGLRAQLWSRKMCHCITECPLNPRTLKKAHGMPMRQSQTHMCAAKLNKEFCVPLSSLSPHYLSSFYLNAQGELGS
jgi:hypothetical protein